MRFCIIMSIILAASVIYIRYFNKDPIKNNMDQLIERSQSFIEDKVE